MSAEEYASPLIQKELAKIRKAAPDEAAVRREWRKANALYIEHVAEGRGDKANGNAIMTYYVTRQAYFLYAGDPCGVSLELPPATPRSCQRQLLERGISLEVM